MDNLLERSVEVGGVGDLSKLKPVQTRTAIFSFLKYSFSSSQRFIELALRDRYAVCMAENDNREQYDSGNWPNEAFHRDLKKEEIKHADLAARALKNSLCLTSVAVFMGLSLGALFGRLSPTLPFRMDLALQASGAIAMALSGLLTFHKLPLTWDDDPLTHRVYRQIYLTVFLIGLPITLLGQLLAE